MQLKQILNEIIEKSNRSKRSYVVGDDKKCDLSYGTFLKRLKQDNPRLQVLQETLGILGGKVMIEYDGNVYEVGDS